MGKNIRLNNCIKIVISVCHLLHSGLGTSPLENKIQASLQRGLTLLRRNLVYPPVVMFRKAAQEKAKKELAFLIETTTHARYITVQRQRRAHPDGQARRERGKNINFSVMVQKRQEIRSGKLES